MSDATVPPPSTPDTFPRQYARTRRFSLGEPRSFRISADETRIVFLRSGGSDPVQRLWALERSDDGTWSERLLVDPASLLDADEPQDLPPAEKARRERLREQANGITAFDVDTAGTLAVFAVSGSLFIVGTGSGDLRAMRAEPGAYDPRIAPDGSRVAYVADRGLYVVATEPGAPSLLVIGEADANVSWGVADFIAAEELDRHRGFWWSPDGTRILAARVDDSPVNTWWIADPSNPAAAPRSHRYPAAGTANAIVRLAVFDAETLSCVDVEWTHPGSDWTHEAWPYLVSASWKTEGCTLVLMNRGQTVQRTVDVSPATGSMRTIHECTDDVWVELCPGAPVRLADDGLVLTVETDQTRALAVQTADGGIRVLTPPNMQVRRIVHVDEQRAVAAVTASRPLGTAFDHLGISAETGATHVVEVPLDGSPIVLLAGGPDVGVHDAAAIGGTTAVIRSTSVNRTRADIRVACRGNTGALVRNVAEVALVNPRPVFFRAGPRAIPCALLLPARGHGVPGTRLPVLLDPYGGPHAQRAVMSRNAHATSQWFADQGFAVLVIDGRGTPGPGPLYEKLVHNDFTVGVVDDQVTALHEAAQRYPQLDLSRVAIRGWSFGGFLSAMAVLERPDVFHAAVVGAPVTDWRLYDTGYTERYLGDPTAHPEVYEANSVVARAHKLTRPMMIIHGLADDNVVCAHSLLLSSALLAHGRPHEVLPLSNVTHMTPQEEVAENLLRLQIDFLRRSLPAGPVTETPEP